MVSGYARGVDMGSHISALRSGGLLSLSFQKESTNSALSGGPSLRSGTLSVPLFCRSSHQADLGMPVPR